MPLHLVICLLLAAVSLAASGGEAGGVSLETGYDIGMCQTSLRCGDSVDVHYPFFLANATSAVDGDTVASSYCGYPGMGILCDGGRATLRLGGDSYAVLGIDYVNHTVTLADAAVLGGGGDCPRVTHNVTVPSNTWLSPSPAVNDDLAFFFGCDFTGPNATSPPPDIPPINCSGFPERDAVSFVVPGPDVPQQEEWPRACKAVVVVPVLKDRLLSSLPRLNGDGYGRVLKQGFQLSWDPSAGPCFLCEQSSGQCSYNQTGGFLGCLCPDGSVHKHNGDCGYKKRKTTTYTASAVSCAILLSLLLSLCAIYRKKIHSALSIWKGASQRTPRIESFLQKHEAQHPKRYTYSEMKSMTKSFSHKLGRGGFGTVYKGNLPNGRDIAVKLLKDSEDDGQEFMNEVASIMRTSHVNVVSLLGYCLQGSKRALIYEYMPNGSLERFARGQNSEGENSLSWEKLFDITVGIARGLEYLHRGCSTRIVHFDIKPHNILLDQDFCPKISDFGLAKLCMTKESIISIDGARGTIGYIAPEVFSQQFGRVSSKSDVYSFGMMVLEMVGARNNTHNSSETSSKYFPQWVYEHLEEYCVSAGEISVDTELVRKLIVVGLWCIQLQPNNRPSMTRVVEMLESKANDLQIPPQSLLC
ncbi:hypothetical protein ACP70R_039520 [Stipagrostis hirtigluma subsp. patula]